MLARVPRILGLALIFLALQPTEAFDSDAFPFTAKERLEYEVKWDPPGWMFFIPEVKAGKLIFQIASRTVEEGVPLHRFKGSAISTSSMVKVNDDFESTARAVDLCAVESHKVTHEGKRHREIQVRIDQDHNTALVIEKDVAATPAKTIKNEVVKDFPSCATDLLAAVYRARLLPLQPGGTYGFLLTDNGRTKEVSLKPIRREYLKTDAGFFATQKVEVESFFGGLFKQKGSFYIWFSEDSRHLPIKFEMKVRLGKVYGTLVKVEE